MIIAIDASRSCEGIQKTGVEVVSDELLKHLQKLDDEKEFRYYTPKNISWLPANQQRLVPGKKLWTLISLSFAMLKDKPDVLFVPVHTLPFFCPKKTIKVVHDISSLLYPRLYSIKERLLLRWDLWRTKRLCSTVIVPTEKIKQDLIDLQGYQKEKILVTGWGAPEKAKHITPIEQREKYILFIGRLEEKKNIATLAKAFKQFHQNQTDWKLILVGKQGYGHDLFKHELNHPAIVQKGFVTEKEKVELLQKTSMLAIVSFDEGFSFPLLEAYAHGVPTIISDIPTLNEIAQDASLKTPVDSPTALSAIMTEIANNPEQQNILIEKGYSRLNQFSWNSVAMNIKRLF